jgi:hypothetical protein
MNSKSSCVLADSGGFTPLQTAHFLCCLSATPASHLAWDYVIKNGIPASQKNRCKGFLVRVCGILTADRIAISLFDETKALRSAICAAASQAAFGGPTS